MKYPYPKKAKLRKSHTTYKDGGTKRYSVSNAGEIGLEFIYQDFRIRSTTKGKFYVGYPGDEGSEEIIDSFVEFE